MSEPLRATTAREIDKASVTEGSALAVNGVLSESPSSMQAGDYYFSSSNLEEHVQPSWFERVILRKTARMILKPVPTIVISCPVCGAGIMATVDPWVVQRNPLTLSRTVTHGSPSGSHSFSIKDGLIVLA
ncbi:MAG: hypothetical protein ABSB35_35295 [Bryobacteraceae bacterium]|jgi:hypothetical protein